MTGRVRSWCCLAVALVAAAPTARAQRIPEPEFRTPAMADLHATTRYAGLRPAAGPPIVYALGDATVRGPASPRTRGLQIAAGALGALVVGIPAFGRYDRVDAPDRRVKGDEGYTRKANVALAIGSFVGATTFSYIVGRSDGSHGSLLATALGAGIATIPSALAYDEPYAIVLGVLIVAPLQGLGAEIGYQHTRRAVPRR